MTTQEAREFLKENGFFTDNLWHIDDVQSRFKCDDETAQKILSKALTSGSTIENIHETIEIICNEQELEEVEED
jgi:hypothetical protein